MILNPPSICPSHLHGDEADLASHLELLLCHLPLYSARFHASLSLLDYCESEREKALHFKHDIHFSLFAEWSLIAARDASMSIYHFGKTLAALRRQIGMCPTLSPHFDHSKMRAASRAFRQYFRQHERVRHAISHHAELISSPARFLMNARELSDMPGIGVDERLGDDRMYEATHEGKSVSIKVDASTYNALCAIEQQIFAAFQPIKIAFQKPSRPS